MSSVADEIREVDEALQGAGATPIARPQRSRVIKLVYEGIVLSKKNRHIISSHGAVIPDAKARENERDMVQQFTLQLRKYGITDIFTMTEPERVIKAKKLHTRYFVRFDLYAGNEVRRDLDNQATTLFDGLVKAGALADDSRKFIEGFAVYDNGVDRENPRAEITIRITQDA